MIILPFDYMLGDLELSTSNVLWSKIVSGQGFMWAHINFNNKQFPGIKRKLVAISRRRVFQCCESLDGLCTGDL